MDVSQIIKNDVNRVIEFIDAFLDRMPPTSRVTYEDLVPHVCDECGYPNPVLVREFIRNAVNSRQDLMVLRGKGICKRG